MTPAGSPDVRRARRHRLAAAMLLVVTLAGTVTGCGLRLESERPEALVPDETEVVRQRSTAAAVALEVLAERAGAADAPPAVAEVLTEVRTAAQAHLEALGGVYDPLTGETSATEQDPVGSGGSSDPTSVPVGAPEGPSDAPSTAPATTPTAAPEPVAVDAADVAALLSTTAEEAAEDAIAVEDGALARLLTSVALSRSLLASALVRAADLPAEVLETDRTGDEDGADVGIRARFEVPDTLPDGMTPADAETVVQSEDGLGHAWEIVAARATGDGRRRSSARADLHRERAERWASAAEIAGTGQDPRRSSYDVPSELVEPEADAAAVNATLARLEGELAAVYAALVGTVDAPARPVLMAATADATRRQVALGGAPGPFPALPEHDG